MNDTISRKNILMYLQRPGLEGWFWVLGLVYLATLNPASDKHMVFCLNRRIHSHDCPGCGFGKSVSYLLHGKILHSFRSHVFGPVGFLLILYRIYQLISKPSGHTVVYNHQ